MRAELEQKIRESVRPLIANLGEMLENHVDHDEALRQISEQVKDHVWDKFTEEEKEEAFCGCLSVLIMRAFCEHLKQQGAHKVLGALKEAFDKAMSDPDEPLIRG